MVRRPPRSTRTDTLFPYTTLFRSPELMIARRQAASLNQHLDLGLVGVDGERTLVPPRHTEKVDIFSLGCVYYFVLVPWEHPFGEWYDRESNIMRNQVNLRKIDHIDYAKDLISKII